MTRIYGMCRKLLMNNSVSLRPAKTLWGASWVVSQASQHKLGLRQLERLSGGGQS